ncbi:FAS1-like dehydratase domain-containing protein [Pseudonocardia sichuanensis]
MRVRNCPPGHPNLGGPGTGEFVAKETGCGGAWLVDLEVDIRDLLHGEQQFVYHRLAHAGQVVSLTPTIVDAYSRKGGALQFVVRDTAVHDACGSPIADLRETLVVRQPAAAT